MKKVMILGAGVYQVPLIRTAKKMGLKTIVVSYAGNYPGFELADVVEYVDTQDSEKVLEIARKHQIDGICTTGSDVGVKTIGFVNDALSLSGVSYEAALLANNKYKMKQAFEKHGVRCAKGIKVENEYEAKLAFEKLGRNVVFKTVDSSGSRGIIHVTDDNSINNAFKRSISYSRCDYIMVEEYLEGEEIGAEAFIYGGKISFIRPHRKQVIKKEVTIPIGQWAPAELQPQTDIDVRQQIELAITALGIDNCAINVDIIIKDGKAFIIEIGARAGGGACLPESVSTFFGFNYYEKMLKVALGERVDFKFTKLTPYAARILISHQGGTLKKIDISGLTHPNLVEIGIDYDEGDMVPKFENQTHRIGHIIVKGNSAEEANETLEEVLEKIVVEVN